MCVCNGSVSAVEVKTDPGSVVSVGKAVIVQGYISNESL